MSKILSQKKLQSLLDFPWREVRVKQIAISSIVINIFELALPLYINIVYTVIIPAKSYESLFSLTGITVIVAITASMLKSLRLKIIGEDSARYEHIQRISFLHAFLSNSMNNFMASSRSLFLSKLSSINLLRDEGSLQSLSNTVDILFSILFIIVLFVIGGPFIALPVIVAILLYVRNSLCSHEYFKELRKYRHHLELENINHQISTVNAYEQITSNGLSKYFIAKDVNLREEIIWRRILEKDAFSSFDNYGKFVGQCTYAVVISIGAILVVNSQLSIGSLTASIILVGKTLNPWQNAMSIFKNYMSLEFAREEYDDVKKSAKIKDSIDRIGLNLGTQKLLLFNYENGKDFFVYKNKSTVIKDKNMGMDCREFFYILSRVQDTKKVRINNNDINHYREEDLIKAIEYINPGHTFFEGTILENIANFQVSKYGKSAVFWTVIMKLDSKINQLNHGYNTNIRDQSQLESFENDELMLLKLISALSKKPNILLIDLKDCSFGRRFVDSFELAMSTFNKKSTSIVSTNSRIIESKCDACVDIG